jgi:putative ABC transport system permease protein
MFFEIIFGGKVLYPVISVSSVTISLIVIILIGIVASLYPVSVALKIQPVKAIQTD